MASSTVLLFNGGINVNEKKSYVNIKSCMIVNMLYVIFTWRSQWSYFSWINRYGSLNSLSRLLLYGKGDETDFLFYVDPSNLLRSCIVDTMASAEEKSTGLDSSDLSLIKSIMTDSNSVHESVEKSCSMPGAQLSDKQTFQNREGQSVHAFPVLVDFRRLMQLAPSLATLACEGGNSMIPGVRSLYISAFCSESFAYN